MVARSTKLTMKKPWGRGVARVQGRGVTPALIVAQARSGLAKVGARVLAARQQDTAASRARAPHDAQHLTWVAAVSRIVYQRRRPWTPNARTLTPALTKARTDARPRKPKPWLRSPHLDAAVEDAPALPNAGGHLLHGLVPAAFVGGVGVLGGFRRCFSIARLGAKHNCAALTTVRPMETQKLQAKPQVTSKHTLPRASIGCPAHPLTSRRFWPRPRAKVTAVPLTTFLPVP